MPTRRLISLLGAVFFLSGLASLVYQVSWQRLLTIQHGVGAVSIALIVSVYMLGLGLGSLLGAWLADRTSRPYGLYSLVQLTLGAAGFASFAVIAALGRVTADLTPVLAFACTFVVLSAPTLLMGMTLPLLTTMVTRLTGDFLCSVSRLYFLNTLGAAAGAVLTSYLLVPLLGLNGCISFAASVDVALACAICLAGPVARRAAPPPLAPAEPRNGPSGLGHLAYLLVFATGFMAIGYEIIWYRVIGVLVKDSPYAFSSVLAVYLLGIAVGSLAIPGYLARRPHISRRDLFFTLQFAIGLTVLVTCAAFYHLAQSGPLRRLVDLSFSTDLHPSSALFTSPLGPPSLADAFLLLDVFVWPLAFLFVPTVLMGASFPLIASLALARRGREGAAVGTTYCFAVLGNVGGGLVTGLVLLPAVGTEMTLLAFGSLGLLFGALPRIVKDRRAPGALRVVSVAILLLGSILVFPRPGELYLAMHVPPFAPFRAHFKEGRDAVLLTYEDGDRLRNYINGQGHGYRPGAFFLAEAVEALSHAPAAREVLVIGFGAGSIVEAALLDPGVRRVTVVELCGSVIANLRPLPALARTFADRKLRVVIDDGRRFLQRTDERFDVILMDPLRTTTAYSNNLHSRQFFALAAGHLTQDGVLMVGGLDANAVIARTLLAEFRFVRAYPNFCLASREPVRRDPLFFERLLQNFSLEMQTSIRTFTEDGMDGPALLRATSGSPVNEDWRPASEYYLGLWLRR